MLRICLAVLVPVVMVMPLVVACVSVVCCRGFIAVLRSHHMAETARHSEHYRRAVLELLDLRSEEE